MCNTVGNIVIINTSDRKEDFHFFSYYKAGLGVIWIQWKYQSAQSTEKCTQHHNWPVSFTQSPGFYLVTVGYNQLPVIGLDMSHSENCQPIRRERHWPDTKQPRSRWVRHRGSIHGLYRCNQVLFDHNNTKMFVNYHENGNIKLGNGHNMTSLTILPVPNALSQTDVFRKWRRRHFPCNVSYWSKLDQSQPGLAVRPPFLQKGHVIALTVHPPISMKHSWTLKLSFYELDDICGSMKVVQKLANQNLKYIHIS